jgi:membrane-associated phospholipid phosphatase
MTGESATPLQLREPRVWVIPVLSLLAMAAIGITHGNEPLFLWINAATRIGGDAFWASVTVLGDTMVALALCLILARRRPDLLWAAIPVALLASGWVHLYKPLFDVTRPPGVLAPDAFHVIGPAHHYHSFPSGHTTTAFALAGVCVLGMRLGIMSALPIALAVLVAISRSAVGVHWPLDLLGGACGGWLAAAAGLNLARTLPFGLRPAVQWVLTLVFAGCAVALAVGYDTGYRDAMLFERVIGIAALLAFAATFLPRRESPAAAG